MKVLITHPNFPGQYKHIARALAADGKNQVFFISKPKPNVTIPKVNKVEYAAPKEGEPKIHSYLLNYQKAVYHAQQVWRACYKLKEKGFYPDVMLAHAGWGSALFLKDIFPKAPLLSYAEFYYRAKGADVGFHPDEEVTDDAIARTRIKNSNNLMSLEACDLAISPTRWQKSLHPKEYLSKIAVLHEGIDTEVVKPRPDMSYLMLPNKEKLYQTDEVVTYIARNFEPYRGLPTAMKAIELIQKERPKAKILLVGSEGVSYGANPKGEKSYFQQELEKLDIDQSRFVKLSHLEHHEFVKVLQISSAHIYLTVPFVLSWSMLEAMACGCAVVASDTAPVQEVIRHGYNGLLADFFSPREVADRVHEILDHPNRMQQMRDNARLTIERHYSMQKLLPQHLSLIKQLADGKMPPPVLKNLRGNKIDDDFKAYLDRNKKKGKKVS